MAFVSGMLSFLDKILVEKKHLMRVAWNIQCRKWNMFCSLELSVFHPQSRDDSASKNMHLFLIRGASASFELDYGTSETVAGLPCCFWWPCSIFLLLRVHIHFPKKLVVVDVSWWRHITPTMADLVQIICRILQLTSDRSRRQPLPIFWRSRPAPKKFECLVWGTQANRWVEDMLHYHNAGKNLVYWIFQRRVYYIRISVYI